MTLHNQKEIEASSKLLKASPKRLFGSLMEQTGDRIYIKDGNSRFVAVSQAVADMHGFSDRTELKGRSDFDFLSEEHARQTYEDEQEIIRTGRPIINKIEKDVRPDGSVTWASVSKAPLYLDSSKCVGIIGMSRDITAEKVAQEKLQRSEQRLREQNEIMRSDYASAREVQEVMIPGRVPRVKHVDLAYLWKPMTSVGGDMITFPRNPSNCLLFFMADVSGHGVTAAFYTVLIKYLTNHAAEEYSNDPGVFLNQVNAGLSGRINKGFVTGLAGHFGRRMKDGSRQLYLSHAGHRQVFVYRKASRELERIDLPVGTVMGIPGGQSSSVLELRLDQGDRFYAFTDGILEACDPRGEEFGMERLGHLFAANSEQPIGDTLESVYEAVAEYTGSPHQQDDITILGYQLDSL